MKKNFLATVAAFSMVLGATLITTSIAEATNNDGNSSSGACLGQHP
jgi:hypothetical protein